VKEESFLTVIECAWWYCYCIWWVPLLCTMLFV